MNHLQEIARRKKLRLLHCPIDWPIHAIGLYDRQPRALLEAIQENFVETEFVALNSHRFIGALNFRACLKPSGRQDSFKYLLVAYISSILMYLEVLESSKWEWGVRLGQPCVLIPIELFRGLKSDVG